MTAAQAFSDVFPDRLRRAPWRGSENVYAGHCYVASEAAFHLLGGKTAGWCPAFIRHEDAPHWFLLHEDGRVLDLTAAQFSRAPRYEDGVRKGFLTRLPSKRAQEALAQPEALRGIIGTP